MSDAETTREDLRAELAALRVKVAELEERERLRGGAAEERFRALFGAMTEGVAVHRLLLDERGAPVDYLILDVNAAYTAHTGIPVAKAIGRKASELYGAGGAPYLDVFARVARTGEPTRFEVFFEPMARHFRISVFSPGTGQFATVFEDITERKRIETALSESHAALEARNEELDAYAHTVAHDLKNPVAAVLGCAELLEQELDYAPPEERTRSIEAIGRAARKMLGIIDDLLLLGEVRTVEAPATRLDMAAVVGESVRSLEDVVRRHAARVSLPPSWPAAVGHAPWVERVWINYLGNAIKYGGRPPRVELGAERLPSGHVLFWVRDDGDGIPPEEQRKLFQPYTRLGDGPVPGHGLGLSIVRRIVEKMGGEVGVRSTGRPGEGSVFSFSLPGAG